MSSCFRCTVGYSSFRIQTIISVIYSSKDLFLLPIKCGFDGSKKSRQTSPFQSTTFNFILHNIFWERVFLDETRKTAFTNFPVYQRDVLGWGDQKKRLKKKRFFHSTLQKCYFPFLSFSSIQRRLRSFQLGMCSVSWNSVFAKVFLFRGRNKGWLKKLQSKT